VDKRIKYLIEQTFGFDITDDIYNTDDTVLDNDNIRDYLIYRPKTKEDLKKHL